MTKFYASAGARVGAIISNPKNIERLERESLYGKYHNLTKSI